MSGAMIRLIMARIMSIERARNETASLHSRNRVQNSRAIERRDRKEEERKIEEEQRERRREKSTVCEGTSRRTKTGTKRPKRLD